jgi:uncharacterized protein
MNHSLQDVKPILQTSHRIAVIGVSASPEKPAHYVPEYMLENGYEIVPVNASLVGQDMFGQTVRSSLSEIEGAVDMVDMFRRSEHLDGHLEDILALNPRPKFVWLQLGIRNDEFAAQLEVLGIEVIQDRCLMADHHNLRLQRQVKS